MIIETKRELEIINLINEFKEKNGVYPASKDFNDKNNKLPNSRYLQRKYGGIVKFKEQMGIVDSDHRKGKIRIKKATEINKRNNDIQFKINKKLEDVFGYRNIRQNFAPGDDSRVNIDYLMYHPNQEIKKAIGFEVFYPSTKESLLSCLNIKQHKKQVIDGNVLDYSTKFYFVVTNPEFSQKDIDEIIKSKKVPVNCTKVISYKTFMDFCDGVIDLF